MAVRESRPTGSGIASGSGRVRDNPGVDAAISPFFAQSAVLPGGQEDDFQMSRRQWAIGSPQNRRAENDHLKIQAEKSGK